MFVIGLTGGIASGKSTASAMLKELGAVIIDADQVAKELEAKHEVVWQEIVDKFGSGILQPNGEINRKALGEKVFNNPEALELLNSIVHPRVTERVQTLLDGYARQGVKVAVYDIPLLIEANMVDLVDEVWVVSISRANQIARLMERNNFTRGEAEARLNSQMPLQDKLKYADRVIDNNGTIEQTRQQVNHFWNNLLHTLALKEDSGGSL